MSCYADLVDACLLVVSSCLGLEVSHSHKHVLVCRLVKQQGCHKALCCRVTVDGLKTMRCMVPARQPVVVQLGHVLNTDCGARNYTEEVYTYRLACCASNAKAVSAV